MKYIVFTLFLLTISCASVVEKITGNVLFPVSVANKTEVPSPPSWIKEHNINGVNLWHYDGKHSKTIVFAHGNGMNIGTLAKMKMPEALKSLNANFVLYDYPGYGKSKGVPNQKSVVASTTTALQFAKSKSDSRLFLWGQSIGTGAACLAGRDNLLSLTGIILTSPFDSIKSIASSKIFLGSSLTDEWVETNGFNCAKAAESITLPVLIHHGDKDKLIPIEHSIALIKSFPLRASVNFMTLKGAGHNDMLSRHELWDSIREFIK